MTQIGRNAQCPCGSGKKYKVCHLPQEEAQRKPQTGEDAIILCTPTRGQICYETQIAIEQNMQGVKFAKVMVGRKPVVEARNILAKCALEFPARNGFDFTPREWFVLWADDDAWWQPGSLQAMLSCMRDFKQIDALFAWFGGRVPYSIPFAYQRKDDGESYPKPGIDCNLGDVVPIERAGFHFVIMRLSLLERVGENPFDIPPGSENNVTEDFAFCDRARDVGACLAVGTQMPVFHVDPRDGTAYLPGMPSMRMDNNSVRPLSFEHPTSSGVGVIEKRTYGVEIDGRIEESIAEEMEQRRAISAA